MSDDQPASIEQEKAAASAPIGVSSTHIMIVGMSAILIFAAVAAWTLTHSPDPSERAAMEQAAIAMAWTVFGYFLGSSASARTHVGK